MDVSGGSCKGERMVVIMECHVEGLCYSNAYSVPFDSVKEGVKFIRSLPCFADGKLLIGEYEVKDVEEALRREEAGQVVVTDAEKGQQELERGMMWAKREIQNVQWKLTYLITGCPGEKAISSPVRDVLKAARRLLETIDLS